MSYFRGIENDLGPGAVGCGPGCPCGPCIRRSSGLGERYIKDDEDDEEPTPARKGRAPARAMSGFGAHFASGMGRPVMVTDPRSGQRCQAEERRILQPVEPSAGEVVNVEQRYLAPGARPQRLHRSAYGAYQRLKAAAESDGIPRELLTITSGYRSVEKQRQLWEGHASKYPDPNERKLYVAPPGSSPHHTGRAIDFWLGGSVRRENIPALRHTAAYRWLVCNAVRFGFTP